MKKDKRKIFYVYEHWRPDTNVCFYVGKGRGKRHTEIKQRNKHYKKIAKLLVKNKKKVVVKIVFSTSDEEKAFVVEKKRISKYGRLSLGTGTLVNLTAGGQGRSGGKQSAKTRKLISATSKRTMSNPKNRMAIITSNKIRVHSEETKSKLSTSSRKTANKKKNKKIFANVMIKSWKNPIRIAKASQRATLMNKERWSDPVYRKKMTKVLRRNNEMRSAV